jgi:hypothetical protein
LELAHFPAGMEIFPATDTTPWELIEQIISESDYYIVVIGGRYGSVDEKGLSFTEREYDLAEQLGKPILAFLHRDPDTIPAGKVERTDDAQNKLDGFRKKVLRRTCRTWSTAEDLKSVVMMSLIQVFRTKPQRGWVRGGGPDVTETLARLADLQQRYDELTRENAALRGQAGAPISSDLAGGSELVDIDLRYSIGPNENRRHSVRLAWNTLFFGVAEKLMTDCEKYEVAQALNSTIVSEIWGTTLSDEMTKEKTPDDRSEFWRRTSISDDSFKLVLLQFIALGLVETSSVMRKSNMPGVGNQEHLQQLWKLTRAGMIQFLSTRVRKSAASHES